MRAGSRQLAPQPWPGPRLWHVILQSPWCLPGSALLGMLALHTGGYTARQPRTPREMAVAEVRSPLRFTPMPPFGTVDLKVFLARSR